MDLEDGGWTLALSLHRLRRRARVGAGPDDPAMNLPAIRALEGELLWGGQGNLAKERRIQFGDARLVAAGRVLKKKVARGRWVGAGQRDAAAVAVHAQRVDAALASDDEAGCPAGGRDGLDERRAAAGRLRIDFLPIRGPVPVRPAMSRALVVHGGAGKRT